MVLTFEFVNSHFSISVNSPKKHLVYYMSKNGKLNALIGPLQQTEKEEKLFKLEDLDENKK